MDARVTDNVINVTDPRHPDETLQITLNGSTERWVTPILRAINQSGRRVIQFECRDDYSITVYIK